MTTNTNKRKVFMNDTARKEVDKRQWKSKLDRYVADRIIDDIDQKLQVGRKNKSAAV